MVKKSRKYSHEQEDDADASGEGEDAPVTLAKGGMSPLADRKDPKGWAKSVDAEPATARGEGAEKGAAQPTPAEPVGGWVDGSTGRGKILVPKGSEAESGVRGETDERTPMRLIKAKGGDALGALPPAESLARRLREQEAQQRKKLAAAEAGAKERQEEDRNEQDAEREEEEDEDDEESDQNT